MSENKRTEKHEAARMSLPEDMRQIFDQLVLDYKFAATVHHGSPFVSYNTLAEIIRAGWRLTAQPIGCWVNDNETK